MSMKAGTGIVRAPLPMGVIPSGDRHRKIELPDKDAGLGIRARELLRPLARTSPLNDALRRNAAGIERDIREGRVRVQTWPLHVRLETIARANPASGAAFKTMEPGLFAFLASELLPHAATISFGVDEDPLEDLGFRERLLLLPPSSAPALLLSTRGNALPRHLDSLFPRLARLTIRVAFEGTGPSFDGEEGRGLRGLIRLFERIHEKQRLVNGKEPVPLGMLVELPARDVDAVTMGLIRLARAGARQIALNLREDRSSEPPAQLTHDFVRLVAALEAAGARVRPSLAECLSGRARRHPRHGPEVAWTHVTVDVDGMLSPCCPRRIWPPAPATLLHQGLGFQQAWNAVPFQVLRRKREGLRCRNDCSLEGAHFG